MRKACEWSNYKLLLYWINTLEIKITKEIWAMDTKVANHGNIPIINNEKVELQLGLVTAEWDIWKYGLLQICIKDKTGLVKNGEKNENH